MAVGLLAGVGNGPQAARAATSPLVWTADVGGSIREYATTAEAVFVGTDQNRVRRVDRASGERTAAVDLGAAVSHGGLAVTDSHLVVVTDDDQVSVYRRADPGGSSVDPAFETRLSGRLFRMDTNGEAACVATRDALLALDLAEPSVRWQTAVDEFDAEYLGQPVVWTANGILVGVDDHVAFVSLDSGEVDVPVGHLAADGDLLFGADAEGGRLFAFSRSGDGAALRPVSGTEASTGDESSPPSDVGSAEETVAVDAEGGDDVPGPLSKPELRVVSVVVTVVATLVGPVQMRK